MIAYEHALELILACCRPLRVVERRLSELLGHVLAEPVVAPFPLPLFDNSAVDGFGVRMGDLTSAAAGHPVKLRLAGTVQAGDPRPAEMSSGSALRILTGAPVPPQVEAVVMKEFCREEDGQVLIETSCRMGENIRRRGEECPQGKQLVNAGTLVTPPLVGLIASLGFDRFPVHRRPAVALLVTGNELIAPGQPLSAGQIYDSNSYALSAAIESMGLERPQAFSVADDKPSTRQGLSEALDAADLVVTTGGVSVGDYDFVKESAEEMGVETVFWRIALKPGKPVYFGVSPSGKLVFGLPGNPVSAMVTFHQFVRPALMKLAGLQAPAASKLQARLSRNLSKKTGRLELVRGILNPAPPGQIPDVEPVSAQESHMLSGLTAANCLIFFEQDSDKLESGSLVEVEPLFWSD